jgi:SAM-dependent methyltransferase
VLDAGCGAGFVAIPFALSAPDAEVVAVDANPTQIGRARSLAGAAGARNAEFVCSDVLAFEPAGPLDAVVCVDALEYFDDDRAFLGRAREWLREGGHLVLHCRAAEAPAILSSFRRADPLRDGRIRPGYGSGELAALLRAAGLDPVELRPTITAPAELAFELADPELGPLRSRVARAAVAPLLVALSKLDSPRLGRGAGLLAIARR